MYISEEQVKEMDNKLLLGIGLLGLVIVGIFLVIPSQPGLFIDSKDQTIDQSSGVPTAETSDVAGRLSHNLVLNTPAKKTVGSVIVYETIPPTVNKESTLALAKKFNVTGTLRGDTAVQSDDLVFGVQLTKNSGCAEYMNAKRPNAIQDAPDNLPTDDEAITIATKFLKDRDLYPEGIGDPVPKRENAYTVGKGDEIYFGQIGVWYPRYLNGLKVEGTQLVVYVGGSGDVIGYFANWRDYTPDKEYPLISQQDAFEQMKTEGVSVGMNEKDAPVSIDTVYLAYRTKAGAYPEDYLEPVWVFKGNVTIDGKPVMAVQKSISALSEESVKSLSE